MYNRYTSNDYQAISKGDVGAGQIFAWKQKNINAMLLHLIIASGMLQIHRPKKKLRISITHDGKSYAYMHHIHSQ